MIQGVFQVTVPIQLPPRVLVLSPKLKQVRWGEEFEVEFSYQLGIPKADHLTPFWVTWTPEMVDVEGYTVLPPTVLRIEPNAPRHLYDDNSTVRPTDWQPGVVHAQAPERPSGYSGSDMMPVRFDALVNMWQPE